MCCFTIHDPTTHHPAMHDSCINYSDLLTLCRENFAFGKLYFTEQMTQSLLHASRQFFATSHGI